MNTRKHSFLLVMCILHVWCVKYIKMLRAWHTFGTVSFKYLSCLRKM